MTCNCGFSFLDAMPWDDEGPLYEDGEWDGPAPLDVRPDGPDHEIQRGAERRALPEAELSPLVRLLDAADLDRASRETGRVDGIALARSGRLAEDDLEGLARLHSQIESVRDQARDAILARCSGPLERRRAAIMNGSIEFNAFIEGVLAGIAQAAAITDLFAARR